MMNLDGRTNGRTMGARILCTDCHNSDDNREFGGIGPNGPHGSIFPHIMERRYEFSQAPVPGRLVTNLFPNPILSAEGGANGGPYSLCAKCHDLKQLILNTSLQRACPPHYRMGSRARFATRPTAWAHNRAQFPANAW